MIAYVDVLVMQTKSQKSCRVKCTRVVFAYGCLLTMSNLCSLISLMSSMRGMMSQSTLDMVMYSALVVENNNCDCNLEAQMIGQDAQNMIQLLLDLALLGSVAANSFSSVQQSLHHRSIWTHSKHPVWNKSWCDLLPSSTIPDDVYYHLTMFESLTGRVFSNLMDCW